MARMSDRKSSPPALAAKAGAASIGNGSGPATRAGRGDNGKTAVQVLERMVSLLDGLAQQDSSFFSNAARIQIPGRLDAVQPSLVIEGREDCREQYSGDDNPCRSRSRPSRGSRANSGGDEATCHEGNRE